MIVSMPEFQENNSLISGKPQAYEPADLCDFLRGRSPWHYDSLPMGYLTLDKRGRIVDINRVAAGILGFCKKELMGKDFFTLLDPEDLKIMEKNEYGLQDMKSASQINLRIRTVSGRTWIKAFAMETDLSDHQALSLIFTDITTQKQTEKELGWQLRVTREMDAITEAITQQDPDYSRISRIVLTAAADLTQSANAFMARISETSRSTVQLGFEQVYPEKCGLASLTLTLSPDGRDGIHASLGKAVNTGKPIFTIQPPKDSPAPGFLLGHIPIHSVLAVPLPVNHRPRKLLILANPATPYSQEMVKMVTRLAKLYSIALKLELSG
ncbi:PAS domain S-box protein [Desulfotignum phosphitoxidans]|uniref:PAS/GAF domain-containing protein n=1 Tax=Desulfotignum phosphitoxidans DSM 13687 TaxID=1286635 RepID=S0FZB8_9BACT|nr:GAF domain-containing protein [Desulfotignum phosphitoxidans]EMS78559.1 PAS/GAF domain-containing protein [Desulfotignum phosphitoxidans DSM 13687]